MPAQILDQELDADRSDVASWYGVLAERPLAKLRANTEPTAGETAFESADSPSSA